MGKTVNNLNKSLEGSLELSGYSKTSHTHSGTYAPASHNHTSLTGITSLTFAANSDDSSIIQITKDSATSYTDFIMSDDAGSDMWRWRFKAWDSAASATTAEFNLMTLKATSTTKGQLSVNGNITADSFTEGGTALSSKYAAASHGTHVNYSTTSPKVAGTAAVGSESKVARGDHVHPAQTSVSGNAGTATKLATARTIQIGNKSNSFDGSANITYTLADIGAAAASHGTHLTIGTGASNAAAGNHSHTLFTRNSVGDIGWSTTSNQGLPVAVSAIAYWNGAYSGTASNLTYCKHGAFGNIVTKSSSDYATSSSVGTLSSLKTSAKGNLVAAINELFQNANNGKQLIANAIGSPLSSSDTFSAMSTKITTMKTNLKNFLVESGATIESGKEGLNDLISLLISDSILVKFPIEFSLNSLPISCGQYHAAILKKDGTIATVGYNYSGQLGIGNTDNKSVFAIPNNAGTNIIQIACGGSHTVILTKDGSVKGAGENSSGQLGINTQDDMFSFTNMLNVNNDIIKVACGTNHTLVLKSDGTVWGAGNNSSGQLGTGTSTGVKVLTKSNLTDVVDIIANGSHSFAIDKAGDVWCTGSNGNGQLGMGNYTSYNSFVRVASLSNVKQIACGGNHTLVLKKDGTVWATGYNYYGQLGLGASGSNANTNSFTKVSIDSVSHIACGTHHSALVKTDGTLWTCGSNIDGQLGLNNTTNKATFTKVTTNVSNAQYVFCGSNYTYYIRKDGTVWSCGGNDKGQLGVGTTINNLTFVGLSSSLLG